MPYLLHSLKKQKLITMCMATCSIKGLLIYLEVDASRFIIVFDHMEISCLMAQTLSLEDLLVITAFTIFL